MNFSAGFSLLMMGVLWSFSGIFSKSVLAANCSNQACIHSVTVLAKEKEKLTLHQDYLKKNQDYIDAYGKQYPSAAIKVKSNILIIQLKIEATKNNLQAINNEITKNGCQACITQ